MRTYRDSFQALLLPLNVNCLLFFFVSLSILQHLFIHRMNHFLFLVIPVNANQLDSGVLLVYSALFCCHSASFWYIPVPFLFIPSHSDVMRFYSRVIPPWSSIFRFIPVYSTLFVSFRLIPVSFWLVSVYSGTILVHSVSFRHIPVYSGIFRFVPFRSCV